MQQCKAHQLKQNYDIKFYRNRNHYKRKSKRGFLICILNNFPTIPYDSQGNGKFKDVKNLLRNVWV